MSPWCSMTSVTSMVTWSPVISLATQRRMASVPQNSRWASLTRAPSAKVATMASSSWALTAVMCPATTGGRLAMVLCVMTPASVLPAPEGQDRVPRLTVR